ncbi:MAG: ImmA/IrrE family metallo-endopeptidase [Rhodospirillales bacterium]|nr:ImmA/IrrE family metallo-endopeptidase [Rhodospirillales bacterium]
MTRPIRTEADYEAGLARIAELMDARAGTPEGDELDVLSALVERFEEEHFPVGVTTPLAAIRFRMEQEYLSPRDLEPYIGSRARVSEVLSGGRPLSIDMIRALNQHLAIPAESLICAEPSPSDRPADPPAKPVLKRLCAWGVMRRGETYEAFITRAFQGQAIPALLRRTRTKRTNAKTDPHALTAWCAGVQVRAREMRLSARFSAEAISLDVARHLAMLSARSDGVVAARGELENLGVRLVVLPHLPGTYLDGAAMTCRDGAPVIAMTLRHDRVDNFWFVLLHELAHVAKHVSRETPLIYDDLELRSSESIELEADSFASSATIPGELWDRAGLTAFASSAEVRELARRAGVHPAVVAGRWQNTFKNYRKFSTLLGRATVRPQFEAEWHHRET